MIHSSKRLRKGCRGDTTDGYPAPALYKLDFAMTAANNKTHTEKKHTHNIQ